MSRWWIAACVILQASIELAAEPAPTLKVEKADPPAAVAAAVKAVLGPDAFVVGSDGDAVLMRLWFREEIPSRATADQVKNGLTYREVPATTLVGVVEFPNTFIDFRKQEIPAGTYTLRYALQPETADHLGVTPHRDFVLLTPAAKDKTTDLTEPKALVERSAEVTGGDHPAVMMLFPDRAKQDKAAVVDKGDGVKVLRLTRRVASPGGQASLGFALTVGGHVKD